QSSRDPGGGWPLGQSSRTDLVESHQATAERIGRELVPPGAHHNGRSVLRELERGGAGIVRHLPVPRIVPACLIASFGSKSTGGWATSAPSSSTTRTTCATGPCSTTSPQPSHG